MFRKVIVFGLFEMIQKKKVRTSSPGPGSASRSSRVQRCDPSHFKWYQSLGLGDSTK